MNNPSEKLSIFVLMANPTDTTHLNSQIDFEAIRMIYQLAEWGDLIKIEPFFGISLTNLSGRLASHTPDILHFAGHGSIYGELIFHDENNETFQLPADDLANILRPHKNRLHLVVLSACYSATQAEVIKDTIGCLVGMSKPISGKAAQAFTKVFYEYLSTERDVKTAYDEALSFLKPQFPDEANIPKLLHHDDVDPSNLVFKKPKNPRTEIEQFRHIPFINRDEIAVQFDALLQNDSQNWIFAIQGDKGMGKTRLLEELKEKLAPDFHRAQIDFGIRENRTIHSRVLNSLVAGLKPKDGSSTSWDKSIAALKKIDIDADEQRGQIIDPKLQSAAGYRPLVQDGKVDFLSAMELDVTRRKLEALIDLTKELKPKGIVLFLDNWDLLQPPHLASFRQWLIQDVLLAAHEQSPQFRTVIASRLPCTDDDLQPGILQTTLLPFSKSDSVKLMEALSITIPNIQDAIANAAAGNPMRLLAAICLLQRKPTLDLAHLRAGQTLNEVLGLVLENLDSRSEMALRYGVILPTWSEEILETAGELDSGESWFKKFVSYPFVQSIDDTPHFTFVRAVREALIQQIGQREFQERHGHILAWLEQGKAVERQENQR